MFLEGWFSDSLPAAPIERLSVLRLDGDMYGSTMDSLTNLYAKVSSGGFVIVDDYAPEGCRQAVTATDRGIDDPVWDIDGVGSYGGRRADTPLLGAEMARPMGIHRCIV